MKAPGFVGGKLDRLDHVRNDPGLLAQALKDPRAACLRLSALDPVPDGDQLAVDPMPQDAQAQDFVLLGDDGHGPLFARLTRDIPHDATFAPKVWELAAVMAPDQLAAYGAARSLIDWHARHGFCAVCGSATRPQKAGWARVCTSCEAEHFPRVDPVTIMLAEYDGRVLVGRQSRFPAGRYSALAGFVEPGETIEEAVARELWEEAGVRATHVRYVMSQPWPFPSSLMIACIADVESDSLTLDKTEIEDAKWVDADEVRAAMALHPDAPFIAPPPFAVAWHLFRAWLDQQD